MGLFAFRKQLSSHWAAEIRRRAIPKRNRNLRQVLICCCRIEMKACYVLVHAPLKFQANTHLTQALEDVAATRSGNLRRKGVWPFKECNYGPLSQHTFSSRDFRMHHFCVILFLFLVYNCPSHCKCFHVFSIVFQCVPWFPSSYHHLYHHLRSLSGRRLSPLKGQGDCKS